MTLLPLFMELCPPLPTVWGAWESVAKQECGISWATADTGLLVSCAMEGSLGLSEWCLMVLIDVEYRKLCIYLALCLGRHYSTKTHRC